MEGGGLDMKLGRLLIIDASYLWRLLHRQLHVETIFNLTNSQGVRTGGVFNFFRSLNLEMKNHPDYYPCIVFDAGLSPRRLAVHPNYKHQADKIAERQAQLELLQAGEIEQVEEDEYLIEYRRQRAEIMNLAEAFGIPAIRIPGWEGDDLMKICTLMSDDSIVLTDDKDLIQLLSPTVSIARPMAGEFLTYDEYQKKNNDPGMDKFIITKSIVGDGSDNIPKCAKGVGGVTASKIAEIIVANPDNWKDIVAENKRKSWQAFVSEESLKQFDINMELIDLRRVETTAELQSAIARSLITGIKTPDYFKVLELLGVLEISKLDVDFMCSMLTRIGSQVI